MPINSSTFVEGLPQKDGRRTVTERHTDHLGVVHAFSWLTNLTTAQIQAAVTARATALLAELKAREIDTNVGLVKEDGSLAIYSLNHSTANENFVALREAYGTASRVEAVMIGDFLAARTDAQLRNLFGYTQAQVDTLRANKLTPAANTANAIRTAGGEPQVLGFVSPMEAQVRAAQVDTSPLKRIWQFFTAGKA
jgi:hypothetical protein